MFSFAPAPSTIVVSSFVIVTDLAVPRKLKTISIDPALCKGCSKCARQCPVEAISGKIKEPFVIDQSKCIKCGSCLTACPFGAIKEN